MAAETTTIAITGAARGLGAAIARGFAARHTRLALIDLDAKSMDDIVAECRALGAEVRAYAADVADEAAVAGAFGALVDDFGGLGGLVNNAGILRDGLLVKVRDGEIAARLSLEDWHAVIDVNLTGVFLCGREAATHMIRSGTGGTIVNMSSISRAGNFGQSNYSAAKAGVAALTAVWAKELARHRIRVNAIAPGFVKTEMVASMKTEALERIASGIPLGRLCTPQEIAHACLYLFDNDYMNGRVLEIDGGLRL
ncbi:MAG TPA: SDR family oxidoreductase [Gammaproteobacteria bacterium]|nr:SDR family oxidoreductase [Gammaproteobacteria bacterium]